MLPDASKNSVVHCDICQEPMQKQANGWACYECNNWVDAVEQPRFDPEAQIPERYIKQGSDGLYHYERQFVLKGYPHYETKLVKVTPFCEEKLDATTSGD